MNTAHHNVSNYFLPILRYFRKRKINRIPPTAVHPQTKQPGYQPGCTFQIREMIVLFFFAVI